MTAGGRVARVSPGSASSVARLRPPLPPRRPSATPRMAAMAPVAVLEARARHRVARRAGVRGGRRDPHRLGDPAPGTVENLVGVDGEVLNALQELTRLAVLRQTQRWVRITVDVNGFKARRREEIAAIAKEAAARVAGSRREEELEPMTAFERKIVHDVIAGISGAQSDSVGEEPNRRVVVRPA